MEFMEIFTWELITFRSHPSKFLWIDSNIPQKSIRHDTGVEFDDAIGVAGAGQVQAIDLTESNVEDGRLNVIGAIQAVGNGISTAGWDDSDGHFRFWDPIQDVLTVRIQA